MCVYGLGLFLGRKHMSLVLLDDLNTDLHAKQAKQQARIDYLQVWSLKEVFLDQNWLEERVERESVMGGKKLQMKSTHPYIGFEFVARWKSTRY